MPRFELTGKIAMDGNKWKGGLDQAKRAADKWSGETAKMIKSRLVSAFAVGAMYRGATSMLDKAGQIRKDASRLDVSPEMFQHLESAAKKSKVEIEDVREAMLELSVKQQEVAEGSKGATEAFQRFGLEFDDVINEKPLNLFRQIADSIASGENQDNFIADLDTILSDDGKKLVDAFKNDFFAKVSESRKIGATFSDQQIAEMAQVSEAKNEATQSIAVGAGRAFGILNDLVAEKGHFVALDFDKDFNASLQNSQRLEGILEKIQKNTAQTDLNTKPLNQ